MIYNDVELLLKYGLDTGLIEKADLVYTRNRLYEVLKLPDDNLPQSITPCEKLSEALPIILDRVLDYAAQKGLLDGDTITYRDLFDTKLMACLTPPPSTIIRKFSDLYKESPKNATDFFYKFSQDTNYIRRDRIARDLKWTVDTDYGTLDITINLSKPEKDPRDIAAALKKSASPYPKCAICHENEGYAGSFNQAARQNHRLIPWGSWFIQYSPYVYYNEHCIVLSPVHTPMKITRDTFARLMTFVTDFPHYTLGSNADLPIVGGSILTHDHYQGGCYNFPMAKACVERTFKIGGVDAGVVKWPMSVIRLNSLNKEEIISVATRILDAWRVYSDKSVGIFANTDGTPHNTITPIARRRGDCYELDLVLRNNLTSDEHPLGIFHPHKSLHHIKKENIGLIEVLGLAILPGRLKSEMQTLAQCLIDGNDPSSIDTIKSHSDWAKTLPSMQGKTLNDATLILHNELGKVFLQVLTDAGVFKRDKLGQRALDNFIGTLC